MPACGVRGSYVFNLLNAFLSQRYFLTVLLIVWRRGLRAVDSIVQCVSKERKAQELNCSGHASMRGERVVRFNLLMHL
jgi:hypothetical protein